MKLQVTGARVLLKKVDRTIKSEFGLVMPENSSTGESDVFEVIQIGKDAREDLEYSIGDQVIVHTYNIVGVKIDGEDYHMVQDDEVLAIYGEPKAKSESPRRRTTKSKG